jgi:UDP-2,3-diacylglucosamine hydrolase
MPHTLFISDLHLSEGEPHITSLFLKFLEGTAPNAEALYILGDLFEYWAGDDDRETPFHQNILAAMRAATQSGMKLFIIHGNRDFLMDNDMATACNATILPDPCVANLYGIPTLLTHGDLLCTDDVQYQAFRKQVRDANWRSNFLAQPLDQRKAIIEQLRKMSEENKQGKAMEIMDVNAEAVANMFRMHNCPRMIHGHTHRQKKHELAVDGESRERWVLGDWHAIGNAIRCDATGCGFLSIS